jgi:peptide/nickel transport system substrate-binding protein
VGPHVVSIALDRPDAALLATLSQPFFALQSPRQLADAQASVPVGTGPFRLASSRPGRVELASYADYWAGPPRLAAVVFRKLRDEDALVQALVDGEVDLSAIRASPSTRKPG